MLTRFSRILIADDSMTTRKLVRSMLSSLGLDNVHEASDGKSALGLLNEWRFALVISDWNMQPMNGLELLASIRSSRPFETLPFIIMTTHAVKFAAVAREGGAIHYLVKPFRQEQLAAKMLAATAKVAA